MVTDDASETEDSTVSLVQSVDRALSILEVLAAQRQAIGITELAQRLGVHKSTASRLVSTLEAHDLVEQLQERGKYRLGLGVARLAAAATLSLDIVQVARPALVALSHETGETVNLAILSDDAALYLDQVSGTSTLQSHSWVGQRIPLHATSNGKIFLAYGDARLARAVSEAGLKRYASQTITDPAILAQDLERTLERGWASAVNELEDGLTAVAGPVFGADGQVVASISASGPGLRLSRSLPQIALATCRASAQVSQRLGYVAPTG